MVGEEGEAGPHPGVVIEEVIESASQHGGGDGNRTAKDGPDPEVREGGKWRNRSVPCGLCLRGADGWMDLRTERSQWGR